MNHYDISQSKSGSEEIDQSGVNKAGGSANGVKVYLFNTHQSINPLLLEKDTKMKLKKLTTEQLTESQKMEAKRRQFINNNDKSKLQPYHTQIKIENLCSGWM